MFTDVVFQLFWHDKPLDGNLNSIIAHLMGVAFFFKFNIDTNEHTDNIEI